MKHGIDYIPLPDGSVWLFYPHRSLVPLGPTPIFAMRRLRRRWHFGMFWRRSHCHFHRTKLASWPQAFRLAPGFPGEKVGISSCCQWQSWKMVFFMSFVRQSTKKLSGCLRLFNSSALGCLGCGHSRFKYIETIPKKSRSNGYWYYFGNTFRNAFFFTPMAYDFSYWTNPWPERYESLCTTGHKDHRGIIVFGINMLLFQDRPYWAGKNDLKLWSLLSTLGNGSDMNFLRMEEPKSVVQRCSHVSLNFKPLLIDD